MQSIQNCLLCHSSDFEIIVTRQDRLTNLPFIFDYIRCQQCGWISLTPQPTMSELVQFYPSHYESFLTNHTIDSLPRQLINENERKYQLITHHHPRPGSILDLGCSTGHFLYHMQKHKWQATGIEPSPEAGWQAHKLYGLPIIVGELATVQFSIPKFNVVTMWDVFEHLHNPIANLKQLHRCLYPDGLLIFTIPNLDSFDCKIFQKEWIGWDAPRHLHLCSLDTITTLLQQTGFQLLETRSIGGEYGAFVLSLQTLLYGQTFLNQAKTLPYQLGMLMLRTWLLPYFWLSRALKRSSIITVIAVKK